MKSIYRTNRKSGQEVRRRRRPRDLRGSVGEYALLILVAAVVCAASFTGTSLAAKNLPGIIKSHIVFPLSQVRISGNVHLGEHTVLEAADVTFGQNLLETDLEAIRERLMLHPLVRSAKVRRRLPSEIVVEITERTPAAVILDGRRFIVDAKGFVMALPREGEATLPCLVGLTVDGRRVAGRDLRDLEDGMMIIEAVRTAGFPSLSSLECIDLTRRNDAVLIPKDGRPLVHVGRQNVVERLGRWKAVVRDMAEQWPEIEYVDLRAEGMVVAKPAPPDREESSAEDDG